MNMMIRCGSTNSRAQGNTGPPSKPVFICTVGSRFTLRLHIKDFTLTCIMFRAPRLILSMMVNVRVRNRKSLSLNLKDADLSGWYHSVNVFSALVSF